MRRCCTAGRSRQPFDLDVDQARSEGARPLRRCAQHPSFPAKDLERIRGSSGWPPPARRDNAAGFAGLVFPKLLYGGSIPTVASTRPIDQRITRDDLVELYQKIFVPNNAALIVVGDTKPDVIVAKLQEALHDWKPRCPRVSPRPPLLPST